MENARNDGGYLALFGGVRQTVAEECERLIWVWGSAGHAAKVLAQCRPWSRIEQQICFTLPEADAAEAGLIIERGAKLLRRIPGVRQVTSRVFHADQAQRYCWQLRLASSAVEERLRNDSDFQAFAKRHLEGYTRQIERITLTDPLAGEYDS